tara:strand:- start:9819 stop:10202 length:384 start_codon:yes stop_codon:yes gene_type:complete
LVFNIRKNLIMDIYCLAYNNSDVFVYDLSLNERFEVEAGKSYNFSESLYKSLGNFFNNSITLEEFLEDIKNEIGIKPRLIIPSRNFETECLFLDDDIKNEIFESMINIGNSKNVNTYIPIEMCRYVL